MATKKTTKPRGKKPADVELDGTIKAYCMKCKKKDVKIDDPVLIHMAVRGKWMPAVTGTHGKCGTKLTKFVGQDFVNEVMDA